jgi:hypothetical protein
MQAGAELLERDTLRRDSKLETYRRAAAALCEITIAECSGTALERMRDGFHSERFLGDLSSGFRAGRRGCAPTQHRATADACRSVAHGTEKMVRIARER